MAVNPAGDGIRTHDVLLGKLGSYRMTIDIQNVIFYDMPRGLKCQGNENVGSFRKSFEGQEVEA